MIKFFIITIIFIFACTLNVPKISFEDNVRDDTYFDDQIPIDPDPQPEPQYTEKHYVTQTGEGTQDGTSFQNAWSVSDFNNSTNWSNQNEIDGKIGPNDIVYFSGEISSQVSVKASGSNNNKIVLDGTAVTKIGILNTTGSILIADMNHITVQNFTFDINHTWGTTNRFGIKISGSSSYIKIDKNIFHKSGSGISLYGNVSNIMITRNYFHYLNGTAILTNNDGGNCPSYITIGGARGMGNKFIDVGVHNPDDYYVVNSFMGISQTSHIVISHNIGYNTMDTWGMLAIYGNEVTYALVEYNIFHTFNSKNNRAPINFKADQKKCVRAGPYIIRYNHVWNSHASDRSWGTGTGGINISFDWEHAYIYGNYVHDCGYGISIGISYASTSSGCGGQPHYKDGIDCAHAYIFSNVISDIQAGGINLGAGYAGSYDKIENVYAFNNTIYRSGTLDCTIGGGYISCPFKANASISAALSPSQMINYNILNNLIINSRPNNSDYIAYRIRKPITSEIDYNHFYDTRSNDIKIQVRTGETFETYPWNDPTRPDGGRNDSIGNPNLYNLETRDFRATNESTTIIGKGKTINRGNITTIKIHGTDHEIPWDFALGPNTRFHATDPDKIVIHKLSRQSIGWDIGAYGLPTK